MSRQAATSAATSAALLAVLGAALLTGPVQAQPCHEVGLGALLGALQGRDVDPAAVGRCFGDVDSPPAGSGNWPIQIAAALYLDGELEAARLLPFLRGEAGWSHNGRESFSVVYEAWNVASVLSMLHGARRQGDAEVEAAAGHWLRAWAVRAALSATPEPPARLTIHAAGARQTRSRLSPLLYRGPFLHAAGDRSVLPGGCSARRARPELQLRDLMSLVGLERAAGCPEGSPVELSLLGPLLARMLDWPGRSWRGPTLPEPGNWDWVLWAAERLSGRAYGEPSPAAAWGLTEGLRSQLTAFVRRPSPEGAEELVKVLGGYPRRPGHAYRWLYHREGLTTVLEGSDNANKPSFVLAASRGRESLWWGPSPWRGVGAPAAFARLSNDLGEAAVWSSADPTAVQRVELPEVVFGVEWDERGARLLGSGEPPAGDDDDGQDGDGDGDGEDGDDETAEERLLRRLERDLEAASEALETARQRLGRLRRDG